MSKRFVTQAPSHRNAYDLFADRWASDLGEVVPGLPASGVPAFASDPRPRQAAEHLGRDGRLDGYDILELGPLEAGHTHQLERLGARRITAVESNSDAFLKCLVVKNMLGLDRSTFLLGDATQYLAETEARSDLIFCSGILYHMHDPVELLRLCAARSDRLFIWTHYYRDQPRLRHLKPRPYRDHGLDLVRHEFTYVGTKLGRFWGGNRATTHWLELDAILAVLARFGLTQTTVIDDQPDFPHGPAATLAACRPGAAPVLA